MTEIVNVATKALLSGVLVLLAAVMLWQVWRIWVSRTLVLAPFDFVEDGKPSAESGEQFARMVRADLVQLAGLYGAGDGTNAAVIPSADARERVAAMDLPSVIDSSFFDDMEIKAYGIEFGSIFKSLRRRLESPGEIKGNVTHQGDRYSVFVELKRPHSGDQAPLRWTVHYAKEMPEASHGVACRLFRFLAGSADPANRHAALFRVPDDEDFCLFNRALASYDQYRLRKAVLSVDDSAALLAQADGPLYNLLGREPVTFPFVFKLAALVRYEQKKYTEAGTAMDRYMTWLHDSNLTDRAAEELLTNIASRKLQTTPALSRLRPVQPGTSVGPLGGAKAAGMICCMVKDPEGRQYLVTAAQVLGSVVGTKIVQPAVRDGGTEKDVVAELSRATDIIAIARVRDAPEPRILELGEIKGIETAPKDGQLVATFGFDGKRREGKVISSGVTLDISVEADQGKAELAVEGAIITSDISAGGEIGGPVTTLDGKLIGMIFATGGPSTVVLPLGPEFKKLGVELMK